MLPHQRPMRMVTEILTHSGDSLTALAFISKDNPLLQRNTFPGYATLELLAQASGLFLGLCFVEKPGPGAIISIRGMKVHIAWLDIDEPLKIEIRFLGGNENTAMFKGCVMRKKVVVLEATLTVSRFREGVMP